MAAKDDGDSVKVEGDQRIADLARCMFSTKESAKENGSWHEKGYQRGKCAKMERKNPWQMGSGKTGSNGQEKSGKGEKSEHVGHIARQATLQRGVEKVATQIRLKKQLAMTKICKHGVC